MKIINFLIILVLGGFLLCPFKPALAQNQLDIYFFWGEGCPHCSKELAILQDLKNKYPAIKVYCFETYKNRENAALLQNIGQELAIKISGIPFLFIGENWFVGFSEGATAPTLEREVIYCLESGCNNIVAGLIGPAEKINSLELQKEELETDVGNIPKEEKQDKITLPLLKKELDPKSFSLPVLTIILGFLDGFNPCAMWVLLFLISLLLGMKDRKRMWILGTAFIIISAAVYFLFMAAWLNLIIFLGFIAFVRIIIGLVSLAGGAYNLKEFFTNKNSGCKVTKGQKRQQVFEKIKKITQMNSFWLAMGGIILLAFAVNLVELICSAGLPAIYTQILALNDLSTWKYYSYIALYILVFMLDDLFVFFAAMITLKMTGITTKYTRVSKLIGGILMAIIGLLLILKPEWLMFG